MHRSCFRRASLGIALALLALGSRHAQAGEVHTPVTFSTGFLDSSNNLQPSMSLDIQTNTSPFGWETLTFTGSNGAITDTTPFYTQLGTISAALEGPGYNPGLPDNVAFNLTIAQTDPTNGNGGITNSLSVSGHLLFAFDKFQISFNTTSVTIGDVTYQLGDLVHHRRGPDTFTPYTAGTAYDIGIITSGFLQPGPFTLNAQVTAAPEPSTLVSAGMGLAMFGLTWTVRRRRKSA